MSVRERVKAVIATSLGPELRSRGFKKSHLRFSRSHGLTEQTIWLELSSWNRGSNGRYSVWVSVKFSEIAASSPHPDFFSPIHAITDLAPPQFEVSVDIPVEQAAAELSLIVLEGVVSHLDSVTSLAAFESLGWSSAMPWGFAPKMAYYLGKDSEAAALIAQEAAFFADRGVTQDELVERYQLARLRR